MADRARAHRDPQEHSVDRDQVGLVVPVVRDSAVPDQVEHPVDQAVRVVPEREAVPAAVRDRVVNAARPAVEGVVAVEERTISSHR